MIIFIGLILNAIAVTVLYIIARKHWGWETALNMQVFTIVAWALIAVMLIILLCTYLEAPALVLSNQQIYESLMYQVENHLYDNDNDVGKVELMRQVTDWNKDLAKNKYHQRNIWYGIFVPNVYDEFNFIELKRIT